MGGGGVPLSRRFWVVVVVVRPVVLLPFEGEGGGWSFVFAGAPSIVVIVGIVLRRFCVLSSRVVLVMCPRHHMSSALHVLVVVVCPRRVIVSCHRRCPMLLSLLCPHCDMLFGCTMWHLC